MSAKRYNTQEYAKIEIYGHSSLMTAQMKNLSASGAFFQISHADFIPKIGDLINVTVKLNSLAKERRVDARVIWTKGLAMGVCFVPKDLVELFHRPRL